MVVEKELHLVLQVELQVELWAVHQVVLQVELWAVLQVELWAVHQVVLQVEYVCDLGSAHLLVELQVELPVELQEDKIMMIMNQNTPSWISCGMALTGAA